MPSIPDKDRRCREIEALIAKGMGVCESCREIGISEKTFYRWRKAKTVGEVANARIN
jgi:transposase-like protein